MRKILLFIAMFSNAPSVLDAQELKSIKSVQPMEGIKIKKSPVEGWDKEIKRVQLLVNEATKGEMSAKFSIPTNLDQASFDSYLRLKQLPPIESFFFGVPETVCFPDERDQITNPDQTPYSAICQLIITMSTGDQAIGNRMVAIAETCCYSWSLCP